MASAQQSGERTATASLIEATSPDRRILAIDIGGTGLKAALLNSDGEMLTERVRVKTPKSCRPDTLVEKLIELIAPLPDYACVSIGFPGVVRDGKVVTAPNLGTKQMRGFDLQGALEEKLGKPVRLLNDADMQGLAAVEGKGVEIVLTLGTGFGTALFMDGRLAPHLEISHMLFRKGETFDEQLGAAALKKIGKKKWNNRVRLAIRALRDMANFDRLYVGGGNAGQVTLELDPDVKVIPKECGVRGGAWLWRDKFGFEE